MNRQEQDPAVPDGITAGCAIASILFSILVWIAISMTIWKVLFA